MDRVISAWRKSSFSGTGTNCLETATLPGMVAVRDTTDRQGPVLRVSSADWQRFTAGIRQA